METTQRTWSMSALEFTVLWHAIGRDVLPYPLHYHSTEDTAAAYEQAYKDAAARLRSARRASTVGTAIVRRVQGAFCQRGQRIRGCGLFLITSWMRVSSFSSPPTNW